jgi:hypothetical protein
MILVGAPAWANNPAHPCTLNYVEGTVKLDGELLSSKSVGSAEVGTGQVLETERGKAEMLLTPGVFLRLGDSSAVRLDSPGLTDTRVAILRGEAMVEVTELYKENHLQVADAGANTMLEKKGLYAFEANPGSVSVYDGEAKVTDGDRHLTAKKGKEVVFTNGALQISKFDRNVHDDLYNWSNVRSEYLSEAAVQSARTYVVNTGGWFGGGWYWNPWFGMYSFLPGDVFLYSPFGWGFYSPRFVYYAAPLYGGARYGGGRYIAGAHSAVAVRSFARPSGPGGFASPRVGSMGFHAGGFGRR